MVSIGKGKGRIGALRKIISYVEELQEDIKDHRVIIGHTDALEIAEMLAEMLREKFGHRICNSKPNRRKSLWARWNWRFIPCKA